MVPGIVYSWSWTILLDELEMYQFFATLSSLNGFIVINLSMGLLLLENIYFLFVFLFTLFFLNTLCIIPNIILVRLFGPIGSGF